MLTPSQRFAPCLWFDNQAEEAVNFYTSVFGNSRITAATRYSKAAQVSCQAEGSVLTIAFELDGQTFTALNGGPVFKFNEAISLVINCKSQDEVDHYWNRLGEGGDPKAQQCGWLKDRYGVSWQVVPTELIEWMSDPEKTRKSNASRVADEENRRSGVTAGCGVKIVVWMDPGLDLAASGASGGRRERP